MNKLLAYGHILTVGVGAATIAAAVVGEPIPVVTPAVAAGLAVAVHHIKAGRHPNSEPEATDVDVEQAVDDVERDDDPLGMFEGEGRDA